MQILLTDFVILTLATWRLASLLVYEDGPAAIFSRLRHAAGLRYVVRQGADGQPEAARVASNWVAEGLTCAWCVGVWCAVLLVLGRMVTAAVGIGWLYDIPAVMLAASAGAVMVNQFVKREA